MNYHFIDDTDSTNSYAAMHAATLADMTLIVAYRQRAGRGQRGNSWESEPYKNLTVTLFHTPQHNDDVPMAVRQFRLSEATALAVADTLAAYGIEARLKWPNDIYVGDRKICGILIEHSLMGARISHSRIGIGLNANQTVFLSDAPNPVSMASILGHEVELPALLNRLASCLETRLSDTSSLHRQYLESLWRADGKLHSFRLRESAASAFLAEISDVEPDGHLVLTDSTGSSRRFMFKEVEFILSE